ncbi:jg7738 [Pararge aegeria aegeria]|uniref:Jg7738 protein n=3 Tax=Pararge aegeria TaxID=116150 RepID=A0A8S4RRG6_9NEOP|nr:jg7738 [Pararge aegeria aegeria]
MIHDQIVRLYIIGYIPRDTKFQPRTRNEIKACEWFPIADLPANRKDMTPKVKMGVGPNAFFMVLPFVKRMRRWVSERKQKIFRRTRHKSMGEIESCKGKNKPISQGLENEIHEYQQNSDQKYKNNHGNHSNTKNGNTANGNRKSGKMAKRQLFTPQNTHTSNFSPVNKDNSPTNESEETSYVMNFVAPSWSNFKFDRRAILDCLS